MIGCYTVHDLIFANFLRKQKLLYRGRFTLSNKYFPNSILKRFIISWVSSLSKNIFFMNRGQKRLWNTWWTNLELAAELDLFRGQFGFEFHFAKLIKLPNFLELIRNWKSFLKFKKLPQTFKMLFLSTF